MRADPARAAILTDVDGTLAPIVDDPAAAAPLPEARSALAELAGRYAVVGCVSGRAAEEARRLVGLEGLLYIGNPGLELLEPGAQRAHAAATLAGHERDAADFAARLDPERLAEVGLRLEDKGPIQALHWRGAEDEARAERLAAAVAAEAHVSGLETHRGRKVIELRPPVAFDKGTAIGEVADRETIRHALYAGDDRTDVDGFQALRDRRANGALASAVCVGIVSPESPPEVATASDLTVPDPAAFADLLRGL